MKLEHHVLMGSAVTAVLIPSIGPASGAAFFAGAILIDFDHYLDFLVHTRFQSFSIRKMFLYHKHLFTRIKRAEFLSLEVFHTLEYLTCMVGFSLWSNSPLLQALTAGMIVHTLSDVVYLKRLGVFSSRAHSVFEYVIRKRNMTQQGIALEQPYQEVLELMKSA